MTTPIATNFAFNFETTHSLTVDFVNSSGQPLNVSPSLTDSDLTLDKIGTDANVPASLIDLVYNGTNPATFTFSGISGSVKPHILSDGNYRASISKQDVQHGPDQMAADALVDFHVLGGDANRDRRVNTIDFNILAGNFNETGHTFSGGNFDYDPAGKVNTLDYNVLAANFGIILQAPPTGPNEITVTARSDFAFDLAWVDAVSGELGWRVQWSLSGQFDDVQYTNLPANTSGWTTDPFGDGTRVWFRSRAYGNGQDTAYTPKRYAVTPLPAPTITSVQALSPSQIKVMWADNSQNETEFQVFRSLSPTGPFAQVGTVQTGQPTEFTDNNLQPNTTYYYYVRAHNLVIDSAPSNIGNATTQSSSGISFSVPSTAQINLDWPNSTNPSVVGYNVYRDISPGFIPSIDNQISGELVSSSFIDVEGQAATTYHYKITEMHLDGTELAVAWSGSASTLTVDTSVPAMPSITSSLGANDSEVTLRWNDNSSNETGFNILQSGGLDGWTVVATTEPNDQAHTIRNLNADTNYTFALQATNTAGTSPATAPTTASTQPADSDYFVMIIGGHWQNQSYVDNGGGVGRIANLLRADNTLNMSVHVYAEYGKNATIDAQGTGQAYTDFLRAFDRGVRKWAFIGYSHGASMGYHMAKRIDDDAPIVNPARLGFSGSIDGIRRNNLNHFPEPLISETRLPPETLFHRNEYQRRDRRLRGNAVPGANVNQQITMTDAGGHISHTTIDHQHSLHDRFADQLIDKLQQLP